ncbi:carboxymuconolactone decarboxylase family protein [Tsukamurella sp. 1534]|uniref:carboxymuconolactone decarboxylase family protein n=1 Tax=Tsukamurella sp. 1534 TaxID=1151061 RepID=UPI00030E1EB6|nr:carboxymuconolactone decarboxylase family protein [Tsukamurella sp. 1534]
MPGQRVRIDKASPDAYRTLVAVSAAVGDTAAAAGLSRAVVELVNLRCSQINGCAYCLSLHHDAGIKAGLTEQQIAVLPAWRDAPSLFDDQQRAALEIAELVTELPDHFAADAGYDCATDVLDTAQTSAVVWAAIAINSFNRLSIVSGYEVRKRG